jgi:hypothetical protein
VIASIAPGRQFQSPGASIRVFMGKSPRPQQALAVSGMFWVLPELTENLLFLV